MPNFRFSGIDIPRIKELSKELTESLSKALDCPTDWITFSVGSFGDGNIFCNGEILKNEVFVHVEWFDRGEIVKDSVAKIITDGVLSTKEFKFAEIKNVTVIFRNIPKEDYYENGERV